MVALAEALARMRALEEAVVAVVQGVVAEELQLAAVLLMANQSLILRWLVM